jgi:hypothetical protein
MEDEAFSFCLVHSFVKGMWEKPHIQSYLTA